MKKTNHLIIASLLFLSTDLYAQQNTVGSGGDISGSGGSISYSVGQIDYSSSTTTQGNINQGVQQPFEFFDLLTTIEENQLFKFSLFPNPTNDFIIIKTLGTTSELTFNLYDSKGRLIKQDLINSEQTSIDARNLSGGSYQLSIINQNRIIQSFKIIKN